MYWDIVVQHVALLNACTSPAVCDPSITICWGWQGCCSWSRCVSTARVLLSSLRRENRASRSQIGFAKWTWSIFRVWPPGEYVWCCHPGEAIACSCETQRVFFLLKACFPSTKWNPASHTGNLFVRMTSTFWALCPDFLSCCCSASFSNHCYPWILRVWLRCSVCLLSVLLYQYRNESAWKAIPGYPLKDDECLELHYAIYDLLQLTRASYFLRQEMHSQIGLAQS